MASGFGVVFCLVGGFAFAIGYEIVSGCLSRFSGWSGCWGLSGEYSTGAFGVYVGALFVIIGVIMLAGSSFVRLLRKLGDSGPE